MSDELSTFSTRWSVLAQMHGDQPGSSWDWFIRRYRGYVAAVLRHLGFRADAVEAATEEFWSYLFRSRAVERADRNGRFRSFLSGVVRNYAKSWRREQQPAHDGLAGEEPCTPADLGVDVDLWAAQLLHLSLARLRREHAADETALRAFFGLPAEVGGEARPRLRATEIAQQIGCKPNAIHQQLFRARERLRVCIEQEVATTVGDSPDLREELLLMLGAVGRARPGLVTENGSP
ncbi:MAG TPA: sigma-70 family RNA polymerase sigma factor [Planctomycetota bacterium]